MSELSVLELSKLRSYLEMCKIPTHIVKNNENNIVLYFEDLEYIENGYSLMILVQMLLDIQFRVSEEIGKFINIIRESKIEDIGRQEYKKYPII